jgi:hypothetical protein
VLRLLKNAKSRVDNERQAVDATKARLEIIAEEISNATTEARKQRDELRRLRDGYESLSLQLITMANSAGFLWHKDAEGRFLFASQDWCNFFWRDHACDVVGFTDQELAERFRVRFPKGVFTFGDTTTCVGSDVITIEKRARCRFFELGEVRECPEDTSPKVILQTEKTPLYSKAGRFIGTVGMAMKLSWDEFCQMRKSLNESGRLKKFCETLYLIND